MYFIYLIAALLSQSLVSQDNLPIISSTSSQVVVKAGDNFVEDAWRIAPEANPDVFPSSTKKITFYTNFDSISSDISPNEQSDLVVYLNGKNSANTRIVRGSRSYKF